LIAPSLNGEKKKERKKERRCDVYQLFHDHPKVTGIQKCPPAVTVHSTTAILDDALHALTIDAHGMERRRERAVNAKVQPSCR
jgi:hypothetical protein